MPINGGLPTITWEAARQTLIPLGGCPSHLPQHRGNHRSRGRAAIALPLLHPRTPNRGWSTVALFPVPPDPRAPPRCNCNRHGVQTPTEHPTAVGPQEAPTAAQARTSRVHRPQGGGGRTPRDHRRSGRDSTELRPQTWVFGPGGGRGGWGAGADAREASARRRLQKGHVTRRARWESSEIARCTQKGHGLFAQSLRQYCLSAISESRAPAPPTSEQARPSTRAARTAPVPVAEPLGGLHRRSRELREAHLRSRRAAEARPPRAGGWALCFTSRLK